MLKVRLVILDAQGQKRRLKITASKTLIGRSSDCDLPIPDSSLSRRHCMIRMTDHQAFVADVESRNGTKLNGEKLVPNEPLELFHNDTLKIGSLVSKVSVRDVETGDPLLRDPSDPKHNAPPPHEDEINELMRSLEEISSQLDIPVARNTPEENTLVESAGISKGILEKNGNTHQETGSALPNAGEGAEHASDEQSKTDTVTANENENENDDTIELHDSAVDATESKTNEESPISAKLRKKPEDSQAAAAEALRRLWGG